MTRSSQAYSSYVGEGGISVLQTPIVELESSATELESSLSNRGAL